MKKPAAGKASSGQAAALAAGAANLAQAIANKKAAAKKPAAKKPAPGRKVSGASGAAAKKKPLTAHQAHLAHLAHLQHLGLLPKAAPKPARRMLALGEGVACCAAEAVAASLRLTGRPVSDADVLALYRHTADDPDTGASIVATLEAAGEYGLADWRPVFADVEPASSGHGPGGPPQVASPAPWVPVARRPSYPLILGVDLPGPHAVLATPDGWWSWGELYDPACWPDAVIEEAWTLTWS